MNAAVMGYTLRRLRRGWRSGELMILVAALVIAVAASSAVAVFSERIRMALLAQTGEAFGADAMLVARAPFADDLVKELREQTQLLSPTVSFPSVVLHADDTALVSIKAVSEQWPARGEIRVLDAPFAEPRLRRGAPAPGTLWVELRLWQDLGLQLGSSLQVGQLQLTVAGILDAEPDRGGGFGELAPRVIINQADLDASGLIVFGSRVTYVLQLRADPAQLTALAARDWPDGVQWRTPDTERQDIQQTLGRAEQFLRLAVLAVTLLAAAAVALAARQHGVERRDEVALLKTLGASGRWLAAVLLADLLLLGGLSAGLGAVLGYAGQAALGAVIGGWMGLQLPASPLWPVFGAMLLGMVVLLGFAAPPVLAVRKTPPLRVLQRNVAEGRSPWIAGLAVATTLALLLMQSGEVKLALWVLAGAGSTMAVLALAAWAVVRGLQPLRLAGGTALRFGLGNIARRQGLSVMQIVALGLALLSLYLITVVRNDLLVSWRDRLPADTPNQFLINIQPEQKDALVQWFSERGQHRLELWPMTRARLLAINGAAVNADSFADPETRDWINREFNISWTARFADDNELLAGEWWPEDSHGQPWLSAEDYAVERLGLALGDRLTLQFPDRELTLTVVNFRETRWDSFRPNFFLVTPPGTLDGVPAQWITSFYLAPDDRRLLPDLIRAFPSVTAIDLQATMDQVRSIVGRIVRAVEIIFGFTVLAGLTVLLAAMETTRSERIRETALLRTLGAETATIRRGLLSEYALLGAIAGLIAAFAAQALVWVLAMQVFELPYVPKLWMSLLGGGLGGLLVATMGLATMRSVLRTPPSVVLRAA